MKLFSVPKMMNIECIVKNVIKQVLKDIIKIILNQEHTQIIFKTLIISNNFTKSKVALLCEICDREKFENESELNNYLATFCKKNDESFFMKYFNNNVNLDDFDKI